MSSTPNFRGAAGGEHGSLLDAIPDGPFRFRLGTRPANAPAYFAPTESHQEILAERRRWLESDPQRYAALLPEGIPVLDAAIKSLSENHPREGGQAHFAPRTPQNEPVPDGSRIGSKLRDGWPAGDDAAIVSISIDAAPWERCLALGMAWEPDFALMRRDASGRMVLVGGCVCFPTNWRLADKMGQAMGSIHDVVPGLTASIGAPIDNFLSRMKPGGCWMRSNWGVARTSQRNQHPDLALPKLAVDCEIDEVWLRIEDQALVPLPEVAGLLFGIRLRHIPFREVLGNAVGCRRLRTAIETMSAEMLAHKNLASIRDRMLNWLDDAKPL